MDGVDGVDWLDGLDWLDGVDWLDGLDGVDGVDWLDGVDGVDWVDCRCRGLSGWAGMPMACLVRPVSLVLPLDFEKKALPLQVI